MTRKTTPAYSPPDTPQDQQQPQQQQGNGQQNQDGNQQGSGQQGGDPAQQNNPEHKKKSRRGLFILAGVIVVLGIAGAIYAFATRNLESTDDAYTEGNAITMAPKVAGYVVELDVDDNSYVKAGQLLLRIDARDYINARDQAKANLGLALAQLASAQANYQIAKVAVPAKLVQAEAQKVQSEAQRVQAEREYKRQHAVDLRATTVENIDTANYQQQSADSQVAYNQAQVDVAKLVKPNLAQAEAQVKQLQAQVDQAQAALNQAELNLSWTELRAPQDGWVTRRNVQLGTYLQVGQSMFQLVSKVVWITANFKETQLDRMRVCQRVDVKVDAYPDMKLTGHVDTIQMGSGSRFSSFPAENATGNYVKIVQRVPVKIVLDASDDLPIPIGLSVEPTIRLGSEKDCTPQQKAE